MKKILILASNPRRDLNLDREIRDLKKVIERAKNQAQFEVEIELAVRPEDLQDLFLEYEPRIVHFCGHGTGAEGLVLENNVGREQFVNTEALSSLFELFDDKVECVLLNACYSEVQANAIMQHINYVVGMSQVIRDDAAIAFATGFYRALGRGKSIEQSYKFGCNAIQLQIADANPSRSRSAEASRKFVAIEAVAPEAVAPILLPEHLKPRLKKKEPLTLFIDELGDRSADPSANHSADHSDSPTQPDLSPDLIQAIQAEMTRKQYRDQTRAAWDDFGVSVRNQPLTPQEYRQRQVLLSKVKDFWVKGVLDHSLHNNALIRLKLQARPDAVQPAFEGVEELPVEIDDSFDGLQTSEIFEQMGAGKTLLILGEPGAGKTIALLKLAQRLVDQAEQDPGRSIPIVFNLSSWAKQRQSMTEWLVAELEHHYQASQALGKTLVEQEQLILLLDGLDEVEPAYQNHCIRALNQFIETHGITEIAVCSRIRDYEALSERLKVRSAVYIQPLTAQQIYQYLDEVGEELTGLKTRLQHNIELRKFAGTPLILSVMSLAYQGNSSSELLDPLGATDQFYQHLFETYVERMLQRRGSTQPYSAARMRRSLVWVAKHLSQTSQTIFLIEQLQPSGLQNHLHRKLYRVASLLIGILILSWVGWVGVLTSGLILSWGDAKIETVETLKWSWQEVRKTLVQDLIQGLILGFMTGLILFSFNLARAADLMDRLNLMIVYGLAGGLVFVLLSGLKGPEIEKKATPNQGIWNSARNAAIVGFIGGLIGVLVGAIGGLFTGVNWLKLELIYGFVLGLLLGGGKACIRHFTLRLMLYCQGYMPWNYAHFLDTATDRLLMQKVGGSYIFVHRMLMEHFAQTKLD